MRLALLGIDDDVAALLGAADEGDWELTVAYTALGLPDRVGHRFPAVRHADDWPTLLAGDVADAVIVAGGPPNPERDEQLRRLVQAATATLVMHPACESIVGYELDMIRRDTNCPIAAWFPGGLHPALHQLAQWAQAENSPLGRVEQLALARSIAYRDRTAVRGQLVRDISLMRRILGDFDQVSAMGSSYVPAAPDPAAPSARKKSIAPEEVTALSVSLSGSGGALARWSLEPAEQTPGGTLTLVGSSGRAVLHMPPDVREWTLELSGAESRRVTYSDWDDARSPLDMLARTIAGGEPTPTWYQSCRDIETAEAVERSVRRGRTIALHQEEHTEERTFKGIMSVGGCGLLLVALAILVVGGIWEGLQFPFRPAPAPQNQQRPGDDGAEQGAAGPQDGGQNAPGGAPRPAPRARLIWRLWPVYPLAVFLLLQLFWLVFKQRAPNRGSERGSETSSADVA